MQVHYGESEVKTLLQKTRIFNKNLGTYKFFAVTDNLDYVVQLTNGKIIFTIDELHNDKNELLGPEQLSLISNRFLPNNNAVAQPQAITNEQAAIVAIKPKKKRKGWRVFWILFIIIVLGIVGIGIYNVYTYNYVLGESFMTQEEKEKAYPDQFLDASGTYRENFWGGKQKITCKIINNATYTSYRNIVIEVYYYSSNDKLIYTNNYIVYKTIYPNSSKTEYLKVENYYDVESISWEVVGAVPE